MGNTLLITTITAFIFGCTAADVATSREANMARKQDPTEEVRAVLAGFRKAFKAQDVDRIMAVYSGDYSNSSGTDKSGLRVFFNGLSEQGVLESTTVSLEKCEIAVDGDSATAGPVTYDLPTGIQSWSYRMKRETDGMWRIIYDEPVNLYQAKVVEYPHQKVIGVPHTFEEGMGERNFGIAWDRFMERATEIDPIITDPGWFGVELSPDDPIGDYIAARAVDATAAIPGEGWVEYRIGGGEYVMTVCGLDDLHAAFEALRRWLESSTEYEHDTARTEFRYTPPDYRTRVYLPVRSR